MSQLMDIVDKFITIGYGLVAVGMFSVFLSFVIKFSLWFWGFA